MSVFTYSLRPIDAHHVVHDVYCRDSIDDIDHYPTSDPPLVDHEADHQHHCLAPHNGKVGQPRCQKVLKTPSKPNATHGLLLIKSLGRGLLPNYH